MNVIESILCPKCEARFYPSLEKHCPICNFRPQEPLPNGQKPFAWDVEFEYRGAGKTLKKTIHRIGPVSKARRAATLHAGFVRIIEERYIATEEAYCSAYGHYDQRM